MLQREILDASVYFGLSSAVSEARRLFTQWMAGNRQLPADIRDIVYSTGALLLDVIHVVCKKKQTKTNKRTIIRLWKSFSITRNVDSQS